MKFLQGLSVFASVASAVSVDLGKRESLLDVKIQMVDNSLVEATITHTGTQTLRLFKTGTILDSAAVEKTEIFSGCKSPSLPLSLSCTADIAQHPKSPSTASASAS